MIPAGKLDRRIRIDQSSPSTDSRGQPVEDWSELTTVYAQRVETSGSERFANRQELAEQSAIYRIRYRDDVTVKMRFVVDGKTYRIEAVDEIGRQEGLDLTGVAIVP